MTEQDPFALWAQQLEELTPAETKEVDRLVDLVRRGKLVTANSWLIALTMRYNFNRWGLIKGQVQERLKG